jgi:hypothetical protein
MCDARCACVMLVMHVRCSLCMCDARYACVMLVVHVPDDRIERQVMWSYQCWNVCEIQLLVRVIADAMSKVRSGCSNCSGSVGIAAYWTMYV